LARFYANENFPFPVVATLQELGHDVLTSLDAGTAGRGVPDEEVLAFGADQARAILTLNRKHFLRLHRERPDHHGILVCTYDPDFHGQAQRIHEAVDGYSSLVGALVRVNRAPR
jgi:hypothetical protein